MRFLKLNVKIDFLVLFVLIFFGLALNFRSTNLRIIAISFWILFPFIKFFSNNTLKMLSGSYIRYLMVLTITLLLFLPVMFNYNTLRISLNGAQVELLTPFLAFFTWPYFLFSKRELSYNSKYVEAIIWTVILFFLFESFYRVLSNFSLGLSYENRFFFKINGFMTTTNVIGQSFAILLASVLVTNYRRRKLMIFFCVLILFLSFSRTAIIASIFIFFLHLYITKIRPLGKIIIITFLLYGTIIGFEYFSILSDGSFLSKIEFLKRSKNLLLESDIFEVLFGFGLDYDLIVTKFGIEGFSPHLPLIKAFMYYGIFGILFYSYLALILVYRNKIMVLPVISFILISMAGAPIFSPALFASYLITRCNGLYESKDE